jgi:hypothetical protein
MVILQLSKRNFTIDNAISKTLNPKSKTLSYLYRDLNSGFPASALRDGREYEILFGKKKLDKRTIKHHLKYLMRERKVYLVEQEKTIIWDLKAFSWKVIYYFRPEFGFPKPFEDSYHCPSLKRTYIHNPFIGREGMVKFIDWLANLR